MISSGVLLFLAPPVEGVYDNDRAHYRDSYDQHVDDAVYESTALSQDARTADEAAYYDTAAAYDDADVASESSGASDYYSDDSSANAYSDGYENVDENFSVAGFEDVSREDYAINEAENYVGNSKDCNLNSNYEDYNRNYDDYYAQSDVNDVFSEAFDLSNSYYNDADVSQTEANLRGSSSAAGLESAAYDSGASSASGSVSDVYDSSSAGTYYDSLEAQAEKERGNARDHSGFSSGGGHGYGLDHGSASDAYSYGSKAKQAADSSSEDAYVSDYDALSADSTAYEDAQSSYDSAESGEVAEEGYGDAAFTKAASESAADHYSRDEATSNAVFENSKGTTINDAYLVDDESLDCDVSSDRRKSIRNYDESTEARDFAGGEGSHAKSYEKGASSNADYYKSAQAASDYYDDASFETSEFADEQQSSSAASAVDESSLYEQQLYDEADSVRDSRDSYGRDYSREHSFGGGIGSYAVGSLYSGDSKEATSSAGALSLLAAAVAAVGAFSA